MWRTPTGRLQFYDVVYSDLPSDWGDLQVEAIKLASPLERDLVGERVEVRPQTLVATLIVKDESNEATFHYVAAARMTYSSIARPQRGS